ncbi:MAG: hypothetical protein KDD06_24655, partial [Phaeodactylibacter sp.]|nr:hypothetical protein [Phaeodactylibacter sp.]
KGGASEFHIKCFLIFGSKVSEKKGKKKFRFGKRRFENGSLTSGFRKEAFYVFLLLRHLTEELYL